MSAVSSFRERLAEALRERDDDADPFGATKWRKLKKFAKVVEALPYGRRGNHAAKRPAASTWGDRPQGRDVASVARMRAANRVPEAMVKVASYGGGRASAVEQLDYISRDGALELETGDGDVIENQEDIRALVDEWSKEFHQRKKGTVRNTIHMVVSAPAGSNPEAVLKAGRGFAEGTFGENHPYALVRHDDCAHPHVHIVARMRGEDGSLFRIEPGGFHELRERFAEQCRENGIEMNATPRKVRGAARGESMALRKMREAGRTPEVDKHAESVVRAQGGEPSEAARQAMAQRQAGLREQAEAHRALARKLAAQAEQDPAQRDALSRQAANLDQLAGRLDEGGSPTRPQETRSKERERERSGDEPPSPKPEPKDRAGAAAPPPEPEPQSERGGVESEVEKMRRKIRERRERGDEDDRDR